MAKDRGWIKVYRKIQDTDGYFDEAFCRNMAWIDLLLLANHEGNSFRVRGIKVNLKRGEIGFTAEKLGVRWKWSRGKVLRFLTELQKEGKIVQQKSRVTTLISIVKYEEYQGVGTTDSTTNGTTDGTTERQQTVQQTDTEKNVLRMYKNDKEETIGGEGGNAPLHASGVSGYHVLPNGEAFIEPTVFFTKADFNGLPENKCSDIVRFLKVVKNVELEAQKVTDLWETFKGMELTYQKPYRNKEDVYRHFLNWVKKQSFSVKRTETAQKSPQNKKAGVVSGVEWIDDCRRVKMSDGTIQDLTIDQAAQAKHNQISPSFIKKTA